MQIDPRHLVQFAIIIEEGNFTTAAERLGTTQPALSSMVKTLELRTGLKLLLQRRRPVLPTDIGKELAAKGQGIRSLLADADLATEEIREGERGTIRIGAPSFFCEYVLADLLVAFRSERPKTRFEIQTGYNRELYQMVEGRKVDIAFGPIVPDLVGPQTQTRAMVNFRHEIVCRVGHPILEKSKVMVADLEEAEWLSHSRESALFQVAQAEMSRLGIRSLGNALQSSSSSALMHLLQNTDCLAVLPVFSVLPGLRRNELAVIIFEHRLPEVTFGLITQKHYSPTPLESSFINHMAYGLDTIQRRVKKFEG
jgi:DNA-binding transcriptional LysR family regulator